MGEGNNEGKGGTEEACCGESTGGDTNGVEARLLIRDSIGSTASRIVLLVSTGKMTMLRGWENDGDGDETGPNVTGTVLSSNALLESPSEIGVGTGAGAGAWVRGVDAGRSSSSSSHNDGDDEGDCGEWI